MVQKNKLNYAYDLMQNMKREFIHYRNISISVTQRS